MGQRQVAIAKLSPGCDHDVSLLDPKTLPGEADILGISGKQGELLRPRPVEGLPMPPEEGRTARIK